LHRSELGKLNSAIDRPTRCDIHARSNSRSRLELSTIAFPLLPIRFHRGVELPEQSLWLDPHDPKPFAFVSHAHSDHLGTHAEIITSKGTSALMRERLPGERIEHVLEFDSPATIRGLNVTLLPAGHVFGSAQLFLQTENESLLYTGDFKLRRGLSAEPTGWRHADTLIMETTYGLPKYAMPPTEETLARMIAFCQEAQEEGAVPVLLGYSLGKAQEILCALVQAGLTPMLHGAVWNMTEVYRKLRPDFPCGYERYAAGETAGKVLVCPPSAIRMKMVTQIKQRRVAVLTGWALDPGAIYRYQCDAAFPLTDHADYPDLLRYVELVQPKRVLTLHGFAAEFARDLRERGVEAWALSEENQLELTLARPTARQEKPQLTRTPDSGDPAPQPPVQAAPSAPGDFARFAAIGEEIAKTTSKLAKIALLSDYLRSLAADELPSAATFLTGRAFPQNDGRVLQTGWSVIHRALLAASGVGEARLREAGRTYADAGKTAFEVLLGRTTPAPFSLIDARDFFAALAAARGPLRKTELLTQRLATLTPIEASYVVKILTSDLRIGLKEGLVEEAIAAAFEAPADDVREANMLVGDLGEVAALAARKALEEATLHLFRPIKCMLASPEPTSEAIWSRIENTDHHSPITDHSSSPHWAEDKFDGIRAQLHLADGRVEIFTRDLKCVTGQFADLAGKARAWPGRAIFDGEILAFAEGKKLSFFDLQKRLGRKTEDDLFLGGGSDVPVIFQAFDLLWLDGESLLKQPLRDRRDLLEMLSLPEPFALAERYPICSADEIEAAFRAARARRNEGLIIKDAESAYTPGRRGLSWLKLKKDFATLDVVVVAAEQGHGKRSHVLSDYTFAVRDEETGALLTIGKAYSGLTDDEIEDLTEHFTRTTIAQHGHYREVTPEIVLEIAFDSLQPSTRHASGLAMRFPRIKAIRRDKTPAEIDTLAYARSLVVSEFGKADTE